MKKEGLMLCLLSVVALTSESREGGVGAALSNAWNHPTTTEAEAEEIPPITSIYATESTEISSLVNSPGGAIAY